MENATQTRKRKRFELLSPDRAKKLLDFYRNAWGKKWPKSNHTICEADISDESGPVDGDVDDALAEILVVPPEFQYQCFTGMRLVKEALSSSPDTDDVLVIRKEYEPLYEILKTKVEPTPGVTTIRGVTVTGHPGIGKTTFLFYLLLSRLEHKLPTAVQLDSENYFIFDKKGATVHSLFHQDDRLGQCWALADSNVDVGPPCRVFRSMAQCVIQMTSPKPERWKEWIKQVKGIWVVMNPPTVPEIAAMLKELGYKTSSTLSFVRKYGPSTRQAICCALRINPPYNTGSTVALDRAIEAAVETLCNSPSTAIGGFGLPRTEGSSVIFICRPLSTNGDILFSEFKTFIPTPHLREIFETRCSTQKNQSFLDLFNALSSHSLTRTAAGWAHERMMHRHLGTGGVALEIFAGNQKRTMKPSLDVLPGSLGSLKGARAGDSFYWMPSSSNFKGVDSVLGTEDGQVYSIQATIAEDHKDPVEGIKKVWASCTEELRSDCTWHYVVVTDTELAAKKYVKKFSEMLRGFRLGNTRKSLKVWGCVLHL